MPTGRSIPTLGMTKSTSYWETPRIRGLEGPERSCLVAVFFSLLFIVARKGFVRIFRDIVVVTTAQGRKVFVRRHRIQFLEVEIIFCVAVVVACQASLANRAGDVRLNYSLVWSLPSFIVGFFIIQEVLQRSDDGRGHS